MQSGTVVAEEQNCFFEGGEVMALILDDDSLLDAADGFAGWDDALADDTLAQELEQADRKSVV